MAGDVGERGRRDRPGVGELVGHGRDHDHGDRVTGQRGGVLQQPQEPGVHPVGVADL